MQGHSPSHNTLNEDYLAKLDLFKKSYEYNSPTRKKHIIFFYEIEDNLIELKSFYLSEYNVKDYHILLSYVILILLNQKQDIELFRQIITHNDLKKIFKKIMFDKADEELKQSQNYKDAEIFFVQNLEKLQKNAEPTEPKSIQALYHWCKNFIVHCDDFTQSFSPIRQAENFEDQNFIDEKSKVRLEGFQEESIMKWKMAGATGSKLNSETGYPFSRSKPNFQESKIQQIQSNYDETHDDFLKQLQTEKSHFQVENSNLKLADLQEQQPVYIQLSGRKNEDPNQSKSSQQSHQNEGQQQETIQNTNNENEQQLQEQYQQQQQETQPQQQEMEKSKTTEEQKKIQQPDYIVD